MGAIKAITAFRILDTRTTNGGHPAKFAAGETYLLPVRGTGAVPLSGSVAIMANITVVAGPSGSGYITLFPSGYIRPLASNVNFTPSSVVANTFLVPLGSDGSISIYSFSKDVHVVIDVQGWVAESDMTTMEPLIPFDKTPLVSTDSQKAAQVLANANLYAMTTWWDGPAQTMLAGSLGATVANDAVRRLSMQALSLSTSLAAGVYDEVAIGVTADAALDRVIELIEAVSSWHVSNHLGGWGESWQSPMWAGTMGRAAWFLWELLPLTTQRHVAKLIEHEADFAARQKIHYLRDAAGTILTAGDSGAEEVSWWATAMQIAVVMLPYHSHQKIWQTEMVRFALASWARPADVSNSAWVNGQMVSSWITGSNVEPNGVVINHNRIASDYSTTTYQNFGVVPLLALVGRPAPQATRQFVGPVYAAFTGVTFIGPSYAASGGITYVPGMADIYYPQPNDWGSGQKLPYALADAQALVYGYDPGTAAEYLDLHLDAQLAMQARFADGKTYANSIEYNYEGREEHVAQLAAELYLTLYLRDHSMVSFTNDPV